MRLVLGVLGHDDETKAAGEVLLPHLLAASRPSSTPSTPAGRCCSGVDGVCVISHGSSSAVAIANALRVAHDLAEADLSGRLAELIAGLDPGRAGAATASVPRLAARSLTLRGLGLTAAGLLLFQPARGGQLVPRRDSPRRDDRRRWASGTPGGERPRATRLSRSGGSLGIALLNTDGLLGGGRPPWPPTRPGPGWGCRPRGWCPAASVHGYVVRFRGLGGHGGGGLRAHGGAASARPRGRPRPVVGLELEGAAEAA